MTIVVARVYDHAPPRGRCFLVERLWPRGVRKDEVALEGWLRDVAPSDALRRWFGHRADRWEEFRQRYFAELDAHPQAWRPLLEAARQGDVTLLYSARERTHNNAAALAEYLEQHRGGS